MVSATIDAAVDGSAKYPFDACMEIDSRGFDVAAASTVTIPNAFGLLGLQVSAPQLLLGCGWDGLPVVGIGAQFSLQRGAGKAIEGGGYVEESDSPVLEANIAPTNLATLGTALCGSIPFGKFLEEFSIGATWEKQIAASDAEALDKLADPKSRAAAQLPSDLTSLLSAQGFVAPTFPAATHVVKTPTGWFVMAVAQRFQARLPRRRPDRCVLRRAHESGQLGG